LCESAVPLLSFSRNSAVRLIRHFVQEADRWQLTLLRECLDGFINDSNSVIETFLDVLDLTHMSFEGAP
jgi:hypothetical protein